MSRDAVQILRLRHPGFLVALPGENALLAQARERILALFQAAFAGAEHPDADEVAPWAAREIESDAFAVFLARRGDDWRGLAIASDWTSPFSPWPWCLHLYAPDDRDVRLSLAAAVAEWAQGRGHREVSALNMSGLSDERYVKAFSPVVPGRVVASYLRFDLSRFLEHEPGGVP